MSKQDKTTLGIFIVLALLAIYMFYRWNVARKVLNTMQPSGIQRNREVNPEETNQDFQQGIGGIDLSDLENSYLAPPPLPGGINIPAGPIVQPQSGPFLGSR